MSALLLATSIILSVGRNLLSKKLSFLRFGTKGFFLCQSVLFLFGAAIIALAEGFNFKITSAQTVVFGVVYGVFLILAQWLYTAALTYGNTSLCATVYSLGFILPTLSGAVVFGEDFSFFDGVGISLAVVSLFACGINPKTATHERRGGRYFFPLLIAMIASGGLGIVQKLQQNSPVASERAPFLLIAFSLASVISLVAALFKGGSAAPLLHGKIVTGALVGVCLGACNLLNTILAGRIASAVFFPTLNIGVILLSAACGVIFFKEKFGKKELFVFIPGVLSIIVLNVL